MEPTDLTCSQCGTAWKLIKAGDGPITCPNCRAVVGPGPTAPAPADTRPVPPVGGLGAAPTAPATFASTRPGPDPTDADDPGLGAPSLGRMPNPGPRRRGRHPLATVAIVLLLVFLVPVALCSVLFAVCSVVFRG